MSSAVAVAGGGIVDYVFVEDVFLPTSAVAGAHNLLPASSSYPQLAVPRIKKTHKEQPAVEAGRADGRSAPQCWL